ncbi:MAG: hypothetical protein ACUVUE_05350 [Candidatus Bathycorpusculaceae bacterium]
MAYPPGFNICSKYVLARKNSPGKPAKRILRTAMCASRQSRIRTRLLRLPYHRREILRKSPRNPEIAKEIVKQLGYYAKVAEWNRKDHLKAKLSRCQKPTHQRH